LNKSGEGEAEGPSSLERRVDLLEEDFRYMRTQIDAIKTTWGR
jgi:hypothetical protein